MMVFYRSVEMAKLNVVRVMASMMLSLMPIVVHAGSSLKMTVEPIKTKVKCVDEGVSVTTEGLSRFSHGQICALAKGESVTVLGDTRKVPGMFTFKTATPYTTYTYVAKDDVTNSTQEWQKAWIVSPLFLSFLAALIFVATIANFWDRDEGVGGVPVVFILAMTILTIATIVVVVMVAEVITSVIMAVALFFVGAYINAEISNGWYSATIDKEVVAGLTVMYFVLIVVSTGTTYFGW